MKVLTIYHRKTRTWHAALYDEVGRAGVPVKGRTRDEAVFNLGVAYGRNQPQFARPLSELITEGETT